MFQALLTTSLWLMLIPAASCGGCDVGGASSFIPLSGAQDVPSDTVIALMRTTCYGGCPAYSLTISADGKVLYRGREHVKRKGEVESRISQEKLKELVAAFKEIDYFDLKDKYLNGKEDCPKWWVDMPYAATSLTLNGKKKTVNHYSGCIGSAEVEKLRRLEEKIDEAVNVDQWIK
jgi:hypothetical protein